MEIDALFETIKSEPKLKQYVACVCDLCLQEQLTDTSYAAIVEKHGGRITWSIQGKVFATNYSGDEFWLIEDGTIGWNSSEGQCGRIAFGLTEFLTQVLNYPYFQDYLKPNLDPLTLLNEWLREERERYANQDVDFDEMRRVISLGFNVPILNGVAAAGLDSTFKLAATKEPVFSYVYEGYDGENISEPLL